MSRVFSLFESHAPIKSNLRRLPGITSVRCVNALPGEAVGTAIFSRGFLLKPERVKETVAKLPGILNGNFDILVDGQILAESFWPQTKKQLRISLLRPILASSYRQPCFGPEHQNQTPEIFKIGPRPIHRALKPTTRNVGIWVHRRVSKFDTLTIHCQECWHWNEPKSDKI